MTTTPIVSVIIPTYNRGHFVADALASVLTQTYRRFEVIVVDDGSTDDTRQRVAAFEGRVRYIYQPNAGLSAARNTAIRASRGVLLALLDDDDVWLPRKLERQVALMEADPGIGVAYGWWACVDEAGMLLPQTQQSTHHGLVFAELLLGNFVAPSTTLIRRVCFDHVGLYDTELKGAEDWDLLLRVAKAGYPFACVPEILMHYRLHSNQLSGDNDKLIADSRCVLAKTFAQLAPGARNTALRKAAYGNLLRPTLAAAASSWQNGDMDCWRRALLRPAVESAVDWESPETFLHLAYLLLPTKLRVPSVLWARAREVTACLDAALSVLSQGPSHTRRRAAAAYVAIAQIHCAAGAQGGAQRALASAVAAWPAVLACRAGIGTSLRSVVPTGALRWGRSVRDLTRSVLGTVGGTR